MRRTKWKNNNKRRRRKKTRRLKSQKSPTSHIYTPELSSINHGFIPFLMQRLVSSIEKIPPREQGSHLFRPPRLRRFLDHEALALNGPARSARGFLAALLFKFSSDISTCWGCGIGFGLWVGVADRGGGVVGKSEGWGWAIALGNGCCIVYRGVCNTLCRCVIDTSAALFHTFSNSFPPLFLILLSPTPFIINL